MTKALNNGRLYYYVSFLAVHIGIVWLLRYVPTQDGPSHIYNLVILKDLLNGGKEWGEYFTAQLFAVPNLGFHLIAYPLLSVFPPLIVEKIFISTYMVLLGISIPLLLWTFNRPVLPLAYFVFPVLFNFTLMMGFYSYAITVPLFIFAFTLGWEVRLRSIFCRFVCLNLAGFALYYFHLIPFIFFLISLVAIIIAEHAGYKRKILEILKLTVITIPLSLHLLFYLAQGTRNSVPDASYLFSFSRFIELIVDLLFFSTVNYSVWQLLPTSLFTFLIVLFGYTAVKNIYWTWSQSRDIPSSEKTLIYLAAALLAIYLLAPSYFGGGDYFNQRFPWVILLIILPLLRIPDTGLFKRFSTIMIAGVVTISVAFNAAILWDQNLKVKKFLGGLNAGIPKGAFVMTYKPLAVQWSRVDVLLHAASYYGLFRGCVNVGNYETTSHYFPVRFKKTLPTFPSPYQMAYDPASIDWDLYPSVQYLLGWDVSNDEKKKLVKYYRISREDGQLSIWQRH